MKITTHIVVLITLGIATTSCGTKTEATKDVNIATETFQSTSEIMSGPIQAIPKAVVYKMTGNATADNVPVQMKSGQIISFPAPADVRGQEPLPMADGYLLDRRGIGENTVFTRWTYAEYRELKQTPSIDEIKAAIIPGAHPTQIHVLPITLSAALSDTAAVNRLIRQL